MNPTRHEFKTHVDGRLAAYATLAAVALGTPVSKANIVYSGIINISVPNTFDGVYLNFATGSTGTSAGNVPGWNWNAYNGGTGLQFFWDFPDINGGLAISLNTYSVLPTGAPITSTHTYINSSFSTTMLEWRAGADGYLGVRFVNSQTGQTNYGWVHLQTSATTGYPATIAEYAYDDMGGNIMAGQVPEPSTMALLGIMAAGAVGVRRWRKRAA